MQLAGQGSEVEEVESKGRNADRTVKENYEEGAEWGQLSMQEGMNKGCDTVSHGDIQRGSMVGF